MFFFFNDTATTEIYTLSLHDALPISINVCDSPDHPDDVGVAARMPGNGSTLRMYMRFYVQYFDGEKWRFVKTGGKDRKSTRLNSSHANISYAVFCLKKKKKILSA